MLFSCEKKSGQDPQPQIHQEPQASQEHLITGFIFKDVNGNPVGDKGTPNVKTKLQAGGNSIEIAIYPNPTENLIAVRLFNPNPNAKKEVWVVAAPQSKELASYNFPQANSALIGGQPVFQIKSDNGSMQGSFTIDLSKFPEGAYRVYAKIDSTLLWDNILKK